MKCAACQKADVFKELRLKLEEADKQGNTLAAGAAQDAEYWERHYREDHCTCDEVGK